MAERADSRPHNRRGDRNASGNGDKRLHDENVELLRRITRLRTAIEGLTRDNAELRRKLARLRIENRDPRAALHGPVNNERRSFDVQAMLCDPCSRNP